MNILDGLNLYANSFKFYYGSDRNSTFVRGFLKQNYKFEKMLSEQELLKIDKTASFMSYASVLISIILFITYFYAIFFNYYLTIIQYHPVVFALMISIPIMVAIIVPYLIANAYYNKYLSKFGEYAKVKEEFKAPSNASEKSIPGFERIKRRVVKETIFGLCLVAIFFGFGAFLSNAGNVTVALIKKGEYKKAFKVADSAVKLVPISSRNYGLRAASEYYLKDFNAAIKDYELANKYSVDNEYVTDVYVVKSEMLNKAQMLKEYQNEIKKTEKQYDKYSLVYSRANYLYKLKDYKTALNNYNILMKAYENDEHLLIPIEELYFRRALTRDKLGDSQGYKNDFAFANNICPECEFKNVSEQQLMPVVSLDY